MPPSAKFRRTCCGRSGIQIRTVVQHFDAQISIKELRPASSEIWTLSIFPRFQLSQFLVFSLALELCFPASLRDSAQWICVTELGYILHCVFDFRLVYNPHGPYPYLPLPLLTEGTLDFHPSVLPLPFLHYGRFFIQANKSI